MRLAIETHNYHADLVTEQNNTAEPKLKVWNERKPGEKWIWHDLRGNLDTCTKVGMRLTTPSSSIHQGSKKRTGSCGTVRLKTWSPRIRGKRRKWVGCYACLFSAPDSHEVVQERQKTETFQVKISRAARKCLECDVTDAVTQKGRHSEEGHGGRIINTQSYCPSLSAHPRTWRLRTIWGSW